MFKFLHIPKISHSKHHRVLITVDTSKSYSLTNNSSKKIEGKETLQISPYISATEGKWRMMTRNRKTRPPHTYLVHEFRKRVVKKTIKPKSVRPKSIPVCALLCPI